MDTLSLIDSGVELDLIDRTLVKDWSLPRRKLKKPLTIWNRDRSINKNKKITDYVKLDAIIDQQRIKLKLTITDLVSQTSFGHISISSSTILTVSMAPESPWKDLSIDTSHISKQSVKAKILGRSTSNYYGTIY